MLKLKTRFISLSILMLFLISIFSGCFNQSVDSTESTSDSEIEVLELSYFGLNSFEDEADFVGWVGRGDGEVIVSQSNLVARTGDYSLFTEGRELDWNGPGAAFPFEGGSTYTISVWVYQDSGSPQTMVLSAEATVDGIPGYQNVHRTECESGEWTLLTGEFRAGGQAELTVIYVETLGAPELSFYIDDMNIESRESAQLISDLPSLKAEYEEYFPIGCAVPLSTFADEEIIDFLASQYNTFTHENELKPENVLDLDASRALAEEGNETTPVLNFDQAKPLLDFAQEHGFTVHGHVLVWFSQTPDAYYKVGYREDGDWVSRDVMLARMENYIAGVFEYLEEHYPGVVTSWDVVNEAIEGSTGALRVGRSEDPQNGILWMDIVGPDYVEKAFEFARQYAPDYVQLYYNDYSVPYEPKLTGIYDLVAPLAERGLIDAVGFQAHYQIESPSVQQIIQAMYLFVDLGLDIRITELDIEAANSGEQEMLRQAMRYKELMDTFVEHHQVIQGVVFWGISDATSWKADSYPLLFDGDMQPKLAFWALVDPSMLPAEIQFANAYGFAEPTDEEFNRATEYSFGPHSFRAVYNEDHLFIRVHVVDSSIDENDSVVVFIDGQKYELSRDESDIYDDGYFSIFEISLDDISARTVHFDVVVFDAGAARGWSDEYNAGDNREMGRLSRVALPDYAVAVFGTPELSLDVIDAQWESVPVHYADRSIDVDMATQNGLVEVEFRVMWDEENLYILVDVMDPHLDDSSATSYEQDSIEIFIDEGNKKRPAYGEDDGQYRLNFNNVLNIDHGRVVPITFTKITDEGFLALMVIPFVNQQEAGNVIGFDVRYNNISTTGTRFLLNFWDITDSGWNNPGVFGLLELKDN